MNRNTSRRGMSVVALIVGVVVVVAVVLGVLYFASDVFHTKIKTAWNDFSKWTPENIAKDPVGYLDFCEEKTKAAQTKLEASRIAIAQSQGAFKAKQEEAQNVLTAGKKALGEIRAAYLEANATNTWPMKWREEPFTRERAESQLVRTGRECDMKDKQIDLYKKGLDQLTVQGNKVQDAKNKAGEQLAAIQISREQLKVKAITDDLKNQLVAMGSALQTSVLGVADEKGTVGIEELASKTDAAVNKEELNKYLGGK